MLIVEGPDDSGKSTLVRYLSQELEWPIAPRVVGSDTKALVDLQRWVEDNLAKGFQQTVFDRHRLISELIYGPILRDQAQPGFDDYLWLHHQLDRLYNEVEPIIIYCLPPWETVQENMLRGRQPQSVMDAGSKIYRAYLGKAMNDNVLTLDKPGLTVMIYNYEYGAEATLLGTVRGQLKGKGLL